MLSNKEATSLELYCRERFRYKRFYDDYIELRYVEDRFTLTRNFVKECSQDHHRGLSEDTLEEVTQSLIHFMEIEVEGLEARSHTGRSI